MTVKVVFFCEKVDYRIYKVQVHCCLTQTAFSASVGGIKEFRLRNLCNSMPLGARRAYNGKVRISFSAA